MIPIEMDGYPVDIINIDTFWGTTIPLVHRNGTNDRDIFYCIVFHDEYHTRYCNIKPGDWVIDLGAHIGSFSVLCASKYKARSVAVEGLTPNTVIMESNVEINSVSHLVSIENKVAVGIPQESTKVFFNTEEGEGGKKHRYVGNTNPSSDPSQNCEVPSITLEGIFLKYNIDGCRVLKMDIEGSEWEVLMESPPHIIEKVDFIAMECHTISDKPISEWLDEFCSRFGFEPVSTPSMSGRLLLKRNT